MFFQNALGIFNYTYTGGAPRAFVYDGNGNLLDDGERTYQWDAKNRLIEAKRGADTWQWSYNAFDQRVSEKKNRVVTKRWVWAGGNQPAEERDAAGNVTRRFYPQGEQAGAVKFFYTKDHLGSIREILGANGTVVSSSRYDAWGVRTTQGAQDAASFGFTGHLEHKELGLVFTLYRAYDPVTGRWLSRDPIGESGGLNLYGYVSNRPVSFIDPEGLEKICHYNGVSQDEMVYDGDKRIVERRLLRAGALSEWIPAGIDLYFILWAQDYHWEKFEAYICYDDCNPRNTWREHKKVTAPGGTEFTWTPDLDFSQDLTGEPEGGWYQEI
jgi:RHS repeat-associated protein